MWHSISICLYLDSIFTYTRKHFRHLTFTFSPFDISYTWLVHNTHYFSSLTHLNTRNPYISTIWQSCSSSPQINWSWSASRLPSSNFWFFLSDNQWKMTNQNIYYQIPKTSSLFGDVGFLTIEIHFFSFFSVSSSFGCLKPKYIV